MKYLHTYFPIMALILINGCAGADPYLKMEQMINDPHFSPDPSLIFANNWDKIIITANSAKTEIHSTGHISTTRNACGFPKDTNLDMANWNDFANNVNAVANSHPSASETCVQPPADSSKYVDGSADLVNDRTVTHLYEYKSGGICTNIADPALANKLLNQITQIIIIADKIDCQNGIPN